MFRGELIFNNQEQVLLTGRKLWSASEGPTFTVSEHGAGLSDTQGSCPAGAARARQRSGPGVEGVGGGPRRLLHCPLLLPRCVPGALTEVPSPSSPRAPLQPSPACGPPRRPPRGGVPAGACSVRQNAAPRCSPDQALTPGAARLPGRPPQEPRWAGRAGGFIPPPEGFLSAIARPHLLRGCEPRLCASYVGLTLCMCASLPPTPTVRVPSVFLRELSPSSGFPGTASALARH